MLHAVLLHQTKPQVLTVCIQQYVLYHRKGNWRRQSMYSTYAVSKPNQDSGWGGAYSTYTCKYAPSRRPWKQIAQPPRTCLKQYSCTVLFICSSILNLILTGFETAIERQSYFHLHTSLIGPSQERKPVRRLLLGEHNSKHINIDFGRRVSWSLM